MSKLHSIFFILVLLLSGTNAKADVRTDIEKLSSEVMEGRSRGSFGHFRAANYIAGRFEEAGLKMFGDSWYDDSPVDDRRGDCRNIIGIMPGMDHYQVNGYIIVGAHYDHLGILGGTVYPGADSNASGVASLIAAAEWFARQRKNDQFYTSSVIFVAFDCGCEGLKGAKHLWERIKSGHLADPVTGHVITPAEISAMIDLDQVGSTLCPPVKGGRRDFIFAIGQKYLPVSRRNLLEQCNNSCGACLELHDTYYGSSRFTDMFYRLGDRKVFIDAGVPTVYFTSGITDLTNSAEDLASKINYEVLDRRIRLFSNYIESLIK